MGDQGFPVIEYDENKSARENGFMHGESFRGGILELAELRRNLMLERNPTLNSRLDELAAEQWQINRDFDEELFEELEGIREGSGCSITQLVILNNYTDFRDIRMDDEGCSTLYIQTGGQSLAGQTWDMHSTAKKYVSVLKVPGEGGPTLLFSLVGCLGMMGYSSRGYMVGVNNLNSIDARSGLLWPTLVRKCLKQKSFDNLRKTLVNAPVTSAHNYLIARPLLGEMWEVLPTCQELVERVEGQENAFSFHTNHCLVEKTIALEAQIGKASTTHNRYALLEKKTSEVASLKDFEELLTDHEGHPKSICSHYESGAQDPSYTCGGAVGGLQSGELVFWRGCPEYDDSYVRHAFELNLSGSGA